MRNAILIGLTLLWPLALLVADDIKPLDVKLGLWETTMTNQMSGMPAMPEEVLSGLTPDQRAKMEAAMKARESKSGQPKVTKSCLTKDTLAKAMTFGSEGNGACKRTVISSSSSKEEIRFECTDAKTNVKSAGNFHLEALNSENIKGASQMSSGDGTHNMNMQISFSSKWLSADCGDLGKK